MGTRAEQSLDYAALPGLPGALQVVEAALLQNCYTRQLLQCRSLRPAAQVHPSADVPSALVSSCTTVRIDMPGEHALPGALQVVEAALLQNCYTRQLLPCCILRPVAQVWGDPEGCNRQRVHLVAARTCCWARLQHHTVCPHSLQLQHNLPPDLTSAHLLQEGDKSSDLCPEPGRPDESEYDYDEQVAMVRPQLACTHLRCSAVRAAASS